MPRNVTFPANMQQIHIICSIMHWTCHFNSANYRTWCFWTWSACHQILHCSISHAVYHAVYSLGLLPFTCSVILWFFCHLTCLCALEIQQNKWTEVRTENKKACTYTAGLFLKITLLWVSVENNVKLQTCTDWSTKNCLCCEQWLVFNWLFQFSNVFFTRVSFYIPN